MENMPQICPKCGMAINPGDNATVCPVCGVAHHLNCWIENQGCAVAACPSKQPVAPVEQPVQPAYQAPVEQPVAPVEQPVQPAYQAPVEQPAYQQPVQPAYQAPIEQPAYPAADPYQAPAQPAYQPGYQQPAQPAYQAPVGPTICSTCGATITGAFCPKCGQPASVVGVTSAAAQYGAVAAPKKKSKAPLIIGIIAAVVVLVIIISAISGAAGPDLKEIYNEYCSSTWADVGSDGSYLRVDTNPYDWDDDGLAYIEAYYAVEEINAALGLPESLFEDMGSTRGMDGTQTRTYSDKNLEVSWSYHPDEGLEVTYRKIN